MQSIQNTAQGQAYGRLFVHGEGAKALLQGQLTCQLDAAFGAHCNPAGRVISLFRLSTGTGEAFYLDMPRTMVPLALKALQKYAIFYRQVRLEDISENDSPVNSALADIRSGIPAIYPETSEIFFTHELNLTALGAISFDKGCYTGQEIIARMHYRGKTKTGLLHVAVSTGQTPVRGNDIYAAVQPCGKIVDYAAVSDSQFEMLVTAPVASDTSLFMDEANTIPLRSFT